MRLEDVVVRFRSAPPHNNGNPKLDAITNLRSGPNDGGRSISEFSGHFELIPLFVITSLQHYIYTTCNYPLSVIHRVRGDSFYFGLAKFDMGLQINSGCRGFKGLA